MGGGGEETRAGKKIKKKRTKRKKGLKGRVKMEEESKKLVNKTD